MHKKYPKHERIARHAKVPRNYDVPRKSRTQLLDELITRVTFRVEGWKTELLSQTWRKALITSVTPAILAYQMVVFTIPKAIKDKFNAIRRDFWWGKIN